MMEKQIAQRNLLNICDFHKMNRGAFDLEKEAINGLLSIDVAIL